MRLTLDYISKHEDELVIKHVRVGEYYRNPYNVIKESRKKCGTLSVWAVNIYKDVDKWRNCSPVECVITDHYDRFRPTYEEAIKLISDMNDPIEVRHVLLKNKRGYWLHVLGERSFYNGYHYCDVILFDLDYIFGNNKPSGTGSRHISKHFAIFDNKKEAQAYINEIKLNSID